MKNNIEENESLETFFNLLNPNKENYENKESHEILSNINDTIINNGLVYLEDSQKQIISKNNSINELNNNTSLLYNYIYSIFITILVLIILGIITYIKNTLNENIYMTLVILVILSYLFYIMYLFNIMYVQNSVNKILTFIRTGQPEVGKITLGKLPKSAYIKELCKKKKALETNTENSSNIKKDTSSELSTKYKNDAYYYNDNNAPKQQLYPAVKSNKFMIYNVDSDDNSRTFIKTSRL